MYNRLSGHISEIERISINAENWGLGLCGLDWSGSEENHWTPITAGVLVQNRNMYVHRPCLRSVSKLNPLRKYDIPRFAWLWTF